MASLRYETFRNPLSFEEISVCAKPLNDGCVAVVIYPPAGIDLYPIIYGRYKNDPAVYGPVYDRARANARKLIGLGGEA